LIEDLLESSLLDAGMLELELEPVQVPSLVTEVVAEVRQTATRHRFVVEFPSDSPLVQADPTHLARVVRNLLENAVKYSPQGGLIVVRGETQPQQILISIADQGIGIAPEHLNRLFEKFFRVRTDATRSTIGSGLGLPIARTIVEAHGGKIWAESEMGRGSTFYVTLPLTPSVTRPDAERAGYEKRNNSGRG
jgi:signal transduction histidine kinase